MIVDIDHDEIRFLLEGINTKLFILEGEEERIERQKIIDFLLESKGSPIKQLAKIFKVDI